MPDTNAAVRDEMREETRRLLIERFRIGLWVVLALLPVFALLDLKLESTETLLRLYLVKLVGVATVLAAFYAVRRAATLDAGIAIVQLSLAAFYALTATSGIVSHDAATTPAVCMVVAVVAAALLPWGVGAQSLTVAAAGLATLANMYVVHHGMALAFGYPALALFAALPVSIYVADRFARHQATLIEREIERRRAQDQLDRFFDLSPDMLAIIGADRRFRKLNPAWTRCLGWDRDELIAREPAAFVHPDEVPATLALREPNNTNEFIQFENRYRHKDGGYRWLSWSASRLIGGAAYVVARDITAAKQAEDVQRQLDEQLRQEAEVAAALARVASELISSLSTPVLLERLCRVTTEVLHCDASHTFLLQADEQAFVAVSQYGGSSEQWEALQLSRFPVRILATAHDRLARDGVVQTSLAEGGALLPPGMLQTFGVSAGLVVALRREGQMFGVHAASYREGSGRFSAQQERIAVGIAQLASFALENARLVEELERVSRFRSDFVATMSHELRTPLNVIMGYQDLLEVGEFGELTAEQLEPLRRANKSARELLDLITATLDLSRLEARHVPLTVDEFEVAHLIEEVAAGTQPPADKPDLTIVWKPVPDGLVLCSDRVKVRMVLKNLIGNAIKFTERGLVTVAAHAANGGVDFEVSDTGIGIPPDAREFIFEAFRQGDSSSTRRHGGVGLGLYIVRRLLERLGGTITVESAIGQGSTFRVWLPLHLGGDTAQPHGVELKVESQR